MAAGRDRTRHAARWAAMLLQPDTLRRGAPPPAQDSASAADTLAQAVAEAVRDAVPALSAVKPDVQPPAPTGVANRASPGDSLAAKLGGAEPDAGRPWDRLLDGVHEATGLGHGLTDNLLLTALLVAVLWGLRWAVLAGVRRRTPDPRTLYQWRKTSSYVAAAVGVVLALRIWIGSLGAFGTFLGLLTAGVAIALRDPLVNLAGWVFILWKRPFTPGDRVSIRQHTGDVIDQRVFQFTLLEVGTATGADQSTGRIVHVPNGWVFSDSVVNFTGAFAYVWHEVAVAVTFESDWRAAKQILETVGHDCADHLSEDAERTLRRAAREYFIFYSKLTPVVYTSVVSYGVQLTLRFLVAPRRVRGSEEAVWEAVLDAFAARDDIAFAYPTTRMFRTPAEGKPGTGGPTRAALPEPDDA